MIAEQNLSNCKTRLKELGADDEDVASLTKPSTSDSLIMSGNEDNYLTALVVKVRLWLYYRFVISFSRP